MNNKNPFFSVVVPVYKVREYIETCINSILFQSFNDYELIIVNDGTPDDSMLICKRVVGDDKRVVIFEQANAGLSMARNAGLKLAKGKYVLFVDSDDTIEPDSLEKMHEILIKKEVDILCCDFKRIEETGTYLTSYSKIKNMNYISGKKFLTHQLKNKSIVMVAWRNIYRTEYLKENNFQFMKGVFHEDEEWTPRVLYKATTVYYCNYAFYNYYIREGSITTQTKKIKNGKDLIKICLTIRDFFKKVPEKKLQKLMEDHLSNIFVNAIKFLDFNELEYKKAYEMFRPKPYFLKTKIKILLLRISRKMYKALF